MWDDKMYDLREELLTLAKKVVNDRLALAALSTEDEEEMRQSLTEDVRFWKDW